MIEIFLKSPNVFAKVCWVPNKYQIQQTPKNEKNKPHQVGLKTRMSSQPEYFRIKKNTSVFQKTIETVGSKTICYTQEKYVTNLIGYLWMYFVFTIQQRRLA